MEKKLPFRSISPTARKLLYKTALLVAGTFLVFGDGFSFRSLFVFAILLGITYTSQIAGRESLRFSYWLFPALTVAGLWEIAARSALFSSFPALAPLLFAVIAAAFFMLLGLGHFFFTDRFLVYSVVNTIEIILLFLVFQPLFGSSLWWFPVFFILFVLLFREAFAFFQVGFRTQVLAASGAAALIVSEIFFVAQFLPLGPLNTAALLALFSLVLRDTLAAHFEGVLDRPFIMRELTIMVLFVLIIFASSRWRI